MRAWIKVLACTVLAAGAGGVFGQPSADRWDRILEKSGATEAQKSQIEAITAQARGDVRLKKAEIGVIQAQIRLVMAAPAPDLKAVGLLVDRKSSLEADLEKGRLSQHARIRQIVGDKVFEKLTKKAVKARKLGKT